MANKFNRDNKSMPINGERIQDNRKMSINRILLSIKGREISTKRKLGPKDNNK